jgi:biotin transporter BioY
MEMLTPAMEFLWGYIPMILVVGMGRQNNLQNRQKSFIL